MAENTFYGNIGPQTPGSSYSMFSHVFKQNMLSLNTVEIVRVIANENSMLTVQPILNLLTADNSGVEQSQIYKVPFLRMQGGENAIIINPVAGDIGLVAYCQRDISNIKNKTGYKPASRRAYNQADAIYVCGIASLNENPSRTIIIDENGITANPIGKFIINGDLEVNGQIKSTGDQIAGQISQQNHIHSGVTPGSGQTGGPFI